MQIINEKCALYGCSILHAFEDESTHEETLYCGKIVDFINGQGDDNRGDFRILYENPSGSEIEFVDPCAFGADYCQSLITFVEDTF